PTIYKETTKKLWAAVASQKLKKLETFEKTSIPCRAMDFLDANEIPIVIAVFAVAIVAFLLFSKKPKGCIDPDNFREFKLVKRTQLSHNVAKFRFALPKPTSVLGLPIGQHISCRHSRGRFKYRPGDVRAFGMIAGGSGITPMFQVARAILEDESDKTKLDLIYANVTVDDILLKEELDTLATKYAGRFKVYYVLNQPPEGWTGGVGFVTKEMIAEHFPAPAFDIKILRCGPPPMNKAMAAHLEALGYGPELLFQF
ncbi:hypothetical protein M8C21_028366, partial [Ambrosia artemisiifolia]